MKVHIDCFPCFIYQAVLALRLCIDDESKQQEILKSLLPFISSLDTTRTPAHSTSKMQRKIREIVGADPFKAVKTEYNKKALLLYDSLSKEIQISSDPLWTATRLSIAGNIIDFSIFSTVDMDGALHRAVNGSLHIDHYNLYKKMVHESENILFLVDNAGEIVFDRLVVDVLLNMGKKVTIAVKGGVVINDATRQDAAEAGFTSPDYRVIDNGSDAVGTILETCSQEFIKIFNETDLIISKGQGNFETLHEVDRDNIFFLFQTKCHVVGNEIGHEKGAMLLKKI
jgi:uncharacterized protein with ATP-grasp and redox domains